MNMWIVQHFLESSRILGPVNIQIHILRSEDLFIDEEHLESMADPQLLFRDLGDSRCMTAASDRVNLNCFSMIVLVSLTLGEWIQLLDRRSQERGHVC